MIPTLSQIALGLSQSAEVSLLTKATALLLIGLAASALASGMRASVRHLLLAATFAALVTTPLLVLAVPETTIAIPVASTPTSVLPSPSVQRTEAGGVPSVSASAPVVAWPPVSWRRIAQITWLAGAALFLAPLAVTLWKLRSLRRTALPMPEFAESVQAFAHDRGIQQRIEVLQHEDVMTPITFGVWRPVILIPRRAAEWPDADLRRALVHEIAHVRRSDWLVQLGARAASAAYWFHPLAWMAWRQLVLEAERACDDAVVVHEERTDYAEQLVTLAQQLSATPGPALGMAHRTDLAARVSALLDDTVPRGRAGLGTAMLTVAGAAMLVLGLAPLRAVAVSPASGPEQLRADVALAEQSSPVPRRLRALDRELLEAAENGDLEDVKDLIDAGANVNAAIDGDGSALIAAARANRLAVMVELLNRGADPNLGVDGDGSPLIAAAAIGSRDGVNLLLSRGATIDMVVDGDENPLIQAAAAGHFSAVQLLVERGADVNARVYADSLWTRERGRSGEWRTPLSQARRGGHRDIVAFLLQKGARD